MSYPEPPYSISSVGSFPEQYRFSAKYFLVPLGVGMLAFNKENFLYVMCRNSLLLPECNGGLLGPLGFSASQRAVVTP